MGQTVKDSPRADITLIVTSDEHSVSDCMLKSRSDEKRSGGMERNLRDGNDSSRASAKNDNKCPKVTRKECSSWK